MNIVIDSNIIFSALIKDSRTRKLILEYDGLFLSPEFIFEKMEKHKKEILGKSKMRQDDFDMLLSIILQKVLVVPSEELVKQRSKALEVVRDIDPDDAVFIACALAHPESILWSDDRNLKKQTKIRVLNTKEIAFFL